MKIPYIADIILDNGVSYTKQTILVHGSNEEEAISIIEHQQAPHSDEVVHIIRIRKMKDTDYLVMSTGNSSQYEVTQICRKEN